MIVLIGSNNKNNTSNKIQRANSAKMYFLQFSASFVLLQTLITQKRFSIQISLHYLQFYFTPHIYS
jgi:hypothetical protein